MRYLKQIALSLVAATIAIAVVRLVMWWTVEGILFTESGDGGTPRIELVTTEQDVGSVDKSEPLKVTFCVANSGTGRLILRDSTGGTPTETNIEPGQTGEIVVALDPEELVKSGTQQIQMQTNDPVQPVLQLTIRGDVQGPTPALGSGERTSAENRVERSVLIRRP